MIYIGIKILVFSSIVTGIYFLFLRRTTWYNFNRAYLLATVPLCFLWTFFRWPVTVTVPRFANYLLPRIDVGTGISAPAAPAETQWGPYLYLAGILLFLAVFLTRIISSIRLLKKYPGIREKNYILHSLPADASPGSFFHHILLPRDMEEERAAVVLRHELAHARKFHSIDKLWTESLGIFFYWLPLYWIIRRELYRLHEFQADREVLETCPAPVYKTLILATALHTQPAHIFQTFSTSNLKTRFMMMNRSKSSRWPALKALLVLPPLALATLAFTLPASQWARFTRIPQAELMVPAGDETVQPEFMGGQTALMDFMSKNIKYPDEAKKNKTEGKVFISFMVLKDGTVSNVAVKKSATEILDKEALRVVKLMPKWKPGTKNGEPADFEMTLPVNFKLD